MKYFVTGERGFIARNLIKEIEARGHTVLKTTGVGMGAALRRTLRSDDYDLREPCVYSNSPDTWAKLFDKHKIDIVIHNAAVVGTDVVALDPGEATLTNVQGTKNIVEACEKTGIPVCYMGTTVVYKTELYQDSYITETSQVDPKTYYGVLKAAGDQIVKRAKVPWMIMRPLFAYGGLGDMNSLIAKTLYASATMKNDVDMFLDPKKIKDYLHVSDFCNAVALGCELENTWNNDYIISASEPRPVEDIIALIDKHCPNPEHTSEKFLKWHPDTDYLGNHRLSSSNFVGKTMLAGKPWSIKISLEEGIKMTRDDIVNNLGTDYNPLKYLEEARIRKIDLTKHY